MRFPVMILTCVSVAFLLPAPLKLKAQEAPSFYSDCAGLRAEADKLDTDKENLTISVEGHIVATREDGALSYIALCGPPHPRVVCVTYALNDRKPGDRVILRGAYQRLDKDFIRLDPCLHSQR